MDEKDKEERRRLVVEGARKQLADGTWPEVMTVFGYRNPKAPRTAEEEFDRLKAFYEQAPYPNLAAFVDLLRFAEKEHGVTMSFNFSTRRRPAPDSSSEITAENAMLFFSSRDVLVGTRSGVEGAAVWLKNFSEAVASLAPESVQVMDKIFGEAIEFLKHPSRSVTVADLFTAALLGEGDAMEPPEVSKQ